MGLSSKMSQSDIDAVNMANNHSEYEDGFGTDDALNEAFNNSSDPFGGGQSDESDPFGGSSDNPFGGNNDPFGGNNDPFGGNNDPFGGNNDPFGGNNNPFGSNNNGFGNDPFGQNPFGQNVFGQQQQEQKPDITDKIFDASEDSIVALGHVIVDMFKSFKLRTADDIGYLNRNILIVGLCIAALGAILVLVGAVANIPVLTFGKFGGQTFLSGMLALGTGLIGIAAASLILEKNAANNLADSQNIDGVLGDVSSKTNDASSDYESNIDDELDSLFGTDSTPDNSDIFGTETVDDADTEKTDSELDGLSLGDDDGADIAPIDFEKEIAENVTENAVLTRETLFNTFKTLLPTNTPNFADSCDIYEGSDDWNTLNAMCIKSIANKTGVDMTTLIQSGVHLVSASETMFAYTIKCSRYNKIKPEDLAFEIENYMKADEKDDIKQGIHATAELDGDNFKIIVTRGKQAIVTMGDCLRQKYVDDFFLNKKNKIPMILGLDELGNVIMEDGKGLPSMVISGLARSGKSWLVLELILCAILFNPPTEIQLLIIDPKESNLFKTIALLPHVFGLHNHNHILTLLDDLINIEAPRRKQILADNRCDDIWAAKKKGVQMPVIYIVIDEFLTVVGSFDADGKKELNKKLLTVLTQMPSLGIFIIIIAHRTTGAVDKTMREQFQLAAAVRAMSAEDVCDTLNIKKWNRTLPNPGDMALRTSNMRSGPTYAKGLAVTTEDADNMMFIEAAAKAFYKMGVEIPDMSYLRACYNRNLSNIKKQLGIDTANIVQFDANGNKESDTSKDNLNISRSDSEPSDFDNIDIDDSDITDDNDDMDIVMDDVNQDRDNILNDLNSDNW